MSTQHFSIAVKEELALALNAYMGSERAMDVLRLINAADRVAREAHQLSLGSTKAMATALKALYADLPDDGLPVNQNKRRSAFDVFVTRRVEAYLEANKPDVAP